MTKHTLVAALLIAGSQTSFAQMLPMVDTSSKRFEHHIGVQANALVKQVLNFSNNAASSTNPYLITYNINHKKSGWGLRFGAGFTFNSTTTSDDITIRKSNINETQLRLGFEKAFRLSGKWTAGIGADFLLNKNDDNTDATTISSDTITTSTETKLTSKGGGVMGWLRYDITKNIVIGTESSFYMMQGTNEQTITITSKNNLGYTYYYNSTKQNNEIKQASFSLPTAIYLTLKF